MDKAILSHFDGNEKRIREGDSVRNVDVKKIVTLRKAGWKTGQIATEMGIEQIQVEEIIAGYAEKKEKRQAQRQEVEANGKAKGSFIVALTQEQIKEIYEKAAAIGAKEALKAFEQERKKEHGSRTQRRLRNTKLLLRNYHMLKEHAEKSVFGRTQMGESALDILESMMSMYDNEVIVESIKRSATRTAVIVSHIETMFGLYLAYCEKAPNKDIEMRRYEIVWDAYMAEDILSAKQIAVKWNMSVDSVYSDLRVAMERLTALIFGADGLKLH